MKKLLEKFDPYNPVFQVCFGLFTVALACATKTSTTDETLFDVVRLQTRIFGVAGMLYFVQFILEKYVDQKDVQAQGIYGITLSFWLTMTFIGLTKCFPVITDIMSVGVLPLAILGDTRKFKWNWYVAAVMVGSLFFVAWQ